LTEECYLIKNVIILEVFLILFEQDLRRS